MSSAPPQTSSKSDSSVPTQTITLNKGAKKDDVKGNVLNNNKVIQTAFRIVLTLFYGQFVANGIYDNLIRTIPYLVDKPVSAYIIIKVIIGVLIIALSVFAMVAIWMHQRLLVFISAIILIVVSVTSLIISIIDIVQKRERKAVNDKEYIADICELTVQAFLRVMAIGVKFALIRYLRPNTEYQSVPTRA